MWKVSFSAGLSAIGFAQTMACGGLPSDDCGLTVVVLASPVLDHDLGLLEGVVDFAVQRSSRSLPMKLSQ